MKNTIELVRSSMYKTELYRSGVKIGSINYSAGETDYYIELDDDYMQTVIDAEVIQIKQLLVQYIDDTSKPSIVDYVNKVSKVEINNHVATQKNTATIDINNFSTSKKTEIEQLTGSKKIEISQYIESTSKPSIVDYVILKSSDLESVGENKKIEIENLVLEKKEEFEVLLNSNNINDLRTLVGPNYKGIYSHNSEYEKGEIYYKPSSNKIKFSTPNSSSPNFQIIQNLEIVKKFKVLEEVERNFELSNYKKQGVVKLNSGHELKKIGDTNIVGFSTLNSWSIVKFSAPGDDSPLLTLTQENQIANSSPSFERSQISKPLHQVFISESPIKKISHY